MKQWKKSISFGMGAVLAMGLGGFGASALASPAADPAAAMQEYLAKRVLPGRFVIKAHPGVRANQVTQFARSLGGDVVGTINRRNFYLVNLPLSADRATMVASLRANTAVVHSAFEDIWFHKPDELQIAPPTRRSAVPSDPPPPPVRPLPDPREIGPGPSPQHLTNDPLLGYQWHLAKIRALATTSGLGPNAPVVAVLDTGVNGWHPDLQGQVLSWEGFNFVDWADDTWDHDGHGTHVAGIIAATADNSTGGRGVCPDCKILPVKVLGYYGGSWFSVMAGIDYADWKIDELAGAPGARGILNMSLGGIADPQSPQYLEMASLLADVAANNKVIVAAAGNNTDYIYVLCQDDPMWCGGYPYTYIPAAPTVGVASGLSVGASTPNDYPTGFSNTKAAYTNVVAPGDYIWSTVYDQYAAWGGTSMAAPVVAGIAGRRWALSPGASAVGITNQVRGTGRQLGAAQGWPSVRRVDLAWANGDHSPGFVGYVVNPEVGTWTDPNNSPDGLLQPVNRVTVRVKDGATVVKTARTNQYGFFTVDGLAPSKAYTLEYVKSGYTTRIVHATTSANPRVDVMPVFMPVARTPTVPYEEILVTLEWDSASPYTGECLAGLQDCTDPANRGAALDLYAQRPDGSVVYWGNWGDGYGSFGRDWASDFMPGGAIYIKDLMTAGVADHYTIAVNRATWGQMPLVQARVRVFESGSQTIGWTVPAACGSDSWWTVATINKTTGAVTSVNTCGNDYPF